MQLLMKYPTMKDQNRDGVILIKLYTNTLFKNTPTTKELRIT